ncbi:MAG: hypothetical protein ACFFAO_07680 [Candidatus Hermodarchaeota archaeon]
METKGALIYFSLPKNKDILRINTDARAVNIKSQQLAKNIGMIGYGFIPNYNNYSDKRSYNPSIDMPFSTGRIESVIMYCKPLKNFWKKRQKNIFLLNNGDIFYFYEYIKRTNRMMKKDIITKMNESFESFENYKIKNDFYKSVLLIEGCLQEKTLIKLLKKYSKWNVIEWRIPASIKGLDSQRIGLKHGFKIVGYDPGSYLEDEHLEDTLIYCYFPNGINNSQFKFLNIFDDYKEMVNKVIKSVEDFKNN